MIPNFENQVDNPIYEPKKKETNPDDGDSAAAPLEVDGVDPASNTYVSSRFVH